MTEETKRGVRSQISVTNLEVDSFPSDLHFKIMESIYRTSLQKQKNARMRKGTAFLFFILFCIDFGVILGSYFTYGSLETLRKIEIFNMSGSTPVWEFSFWTYIPGEILVIAFASIILSALFFLCENKLFIIFYREFWGFLERVFSFFTKKRENA